MKEIYIIFQNNEKFIKDVRADKPREITRVMFRF